MFKDIWMGTQLLFIDIMASLELLLKQMRGRRVTERERKKLKQTLAGIASLIPVTTVMLLPVITYSSTLYSPIFGLSSLAEIAVGFLFSYPCL